MVEAEQPTKLECPVRESKGEYLTADAVTEIIEENLQQTAEEEKIKKIPLHERKALATLNAIKA